MNKCCLFISIIALFAFTSELFAQDSLSVAAEKSNKPKTSIDNQWRDASNYVGMRRARPKSHTLFVNEKAVDNLFLGVLGSASIPKTEDYGFMYGAGASALKWLTYSVGLRVDIEGGYRNSNMTGDRVPSLSAGASALFNVTSYIAGYDKRRFCEVSTVMGIGYSCWWDLMTTHYFTGNVGANVNFRINDRFSLYVEPYLPLHLGVGGLDYGFATKVGAYYDFSTQVYEPTIAGKYYVKFSAGVQTQNSELIKIARQKAYNTAGMSFTLGAGRRFEDYFALQLSAVYSRHIWTVYYGGLRMPANYYAFRVEGVFDPLRLIMNKCGKEDFPLGCGIVLGPEAGCMFKRDLDENMVKHYVGFTGALQVNYRVAERYSIFMEPRMRILPYSAPHDVSTANNAYRNYYDGLFNFNVGLEIDL